MNRTEGVETHQAYRIEQDHTNRLVALEDSVEARRAFVERRPPVWQWK